MQQGKYEKTFFQIHNFFCNKKVARAAIKCYSKIKCDWFEQRSVSITEHCPPVGGEKKKK